MNPKELAAAIEAARKNAEQAQKNVELAQQELARLEAIKLDCQPLMVISATREYLSSYFFVDENLESFISTENNDQADNTIFRSGNYFHTKEQASAYARAISTLLLIRRQPGVVGYNESGGAWHIEVEGEKVVISRLPWARHTSIYIFPCLESEATAYAAVEAVGADNLIFTARFLAGAE